MRYFVRDSTLFIRGTFRAASSGVGGGIGDVTTIVNRQVPADFTHGDPRRYIELLVAEHGYGPDYFGLLTAVEMTSLCILHYDFLTVFVTAGVSNPNPDVPGTINIIVHSAEGLSDSALLETIITTTGAKAEALRKMGYEFTGTTTDAVVVAGDCGEIKHEYAGTLTRLGTRVYRCVLHGVEQSLQRHLGEVRRDEPSLFIFSRYNGEHWVEWVAENCPYYPCHFEGQRCNFCYCPFYPCLDEELGEWVDSSSGGRVWSCQRCRLVHEPMVADYLKQYPEATLPELKKVGQREKRLTL